MLRLVLPKGSLERATLAALRGRRPRASRAAPTSTTAAPIDDPRVADVRDPAAPGDPALRRRGPASTSASPGRDWIEETGADVVTLTELHYSKATARPIRMVLAVAGDSPVESVEDLPAGRARAHRVPGAHPAVLRASTASTPRSRSRTARPRPRSPRSPTRSSRSPRPAARCAPRGSRSSTRSSCRYTELIANPAAYADPEKRKAMEQLQTLLTGALEARGRVLVKLNVDEREPRRRDRAAAGAEVADGVEAVRRRRRSRSRPWSRSARSTR